MGSKAQIARELYTKDGRSIADIAHTLNVSTRTVYRWKKLDLKRGIDWERLRIEHDLDEETYRKKQRAFLMAIFETLDRDRDLIHACDPEKRLEIIEKYTAIYHKLMNAARKAEPELAQVEVIRKTVDTIATLAAEKGRKDIVEFLIDELEEIKRRVAQ
ncbi:DUF1804 family protein [Thermodesulforhabdus norvegica]|uniref:Uncharacterized protein n=1 Tax=Thermodesulforhabdus norvegica TaxID=39841 RepID=A0A1I4SUZ0_9BACT|nr:DUF1804 family protein [Thermodesulforhabdus norvegica]SFM68103.1 Protein of unknown function [Thermodesulforhabdus norvegica]